MNNIEFEITLVTDTSRKFVEITQDFKDRIEQFKNDLIKHYENNPDFPITDLTDFENDHMFNNGYAPESEKVHEYSNEKILQIANDELLVSYPYTYVDEYKEYGGDENDLIVAKKLDKRYYQYKSIINDIVENNLQSNVWQIIDNATKNDDEKHLSKIEANTVAAIIILEDLTWNL